MFSDSTPIANLDLTPPELSYATAGHFSRWLLETHGLDRYRALLQAKGNARKAFENTYDMTMEAAQAQYLAEAPYSYGALIVCEHPDLAQVGVNAWSETLDVDCNSADVRSSPLGMGAHRVLTITERGNYAFSTSAQSGVISRCDDEDLDLAPTADEPDYGGLYGDVPPITYNFIYQYAQAFAGDGEVTVLDLTPGQYDVAMGSMGHEAHIAKIDVSLAANPSP